MNRALEATLPSPSSDASHGFRWHTHTDTHRGLESIFPLRSSRSLHGQGPLEFFHFGTRKRESSLTCGMVIPARTGKAEHQQPDHSVTTLNQTRTRYCGLQRPIAALTLTGSVPSQGLPNGLDPPCRAGITGFFFSSFLSNPALPFTARRNSTWHL
ncbi:hypothetical protein BDV32DRAFT_131431 [Aspergillus pseudonomiae]|nr:hypothetical protein BDV32DRAFT_131431 [Aspergillus pseudonomiae]